MECGVVGRSCHLASTSATCMCNCLAHKVWSVQNFLFVLKLGNKRKYMPNEYPLYTMTEYVGCGTISGQNMIGPYMNPAALNE